MWRRPVAVCGLIRSVAHKSPVQVSYTDVTHAVRGTDGTRKPGWAPHDQIFRLAKTPSVLTSTGSSVTTKPQELPRAATSILRRNHLCSIADIYHQATGISPQAHPLICCRCFRENTALHTTNSHHPLGALPSKTPAANGVTPLRLLAAEHGLVAGHLLMPPRRLRPLPGLRGGFSEEEPDGGVCL